jgi:hypothetical protein
MQIFSFLSKYFRRSVKIFITNHFSMTQEQDSLVLIMERVYYANILDMTNALEKALDEADILDFTKEIHREVCDNIKSVLAFVHTSETVVDELLPKETIKTALKGIKQKMKLQLEQAMTDLPTSDLCEVYRGHVFNVEYLCELFIAYETRHQCQNGDIDEEYRKAYVILVGLLCTYKTLVDHFEN